MIFGNLIVLALKLKRVPILGGFPPSHTSEDKDSIFFGEIFDVPRLSESLGLAVVEWREVKDPASQELDELGCWGVWPVPDHQTNRNEIRYTSVTEELKLDISYTDAPKWIKLLSEDDPDPFISFGALASLAFPDTRKSSLVPAQPSPFNHVMLPPDEQLLCYDFLYYVSDFKPYEYELDFYPAWHQAIQYMRWLPELEVVTEKYVRRTFGTLDGEPTPPRVAIHMRRDDFYDNYCSNRPAEECFASISVIERRVKEVQQELLERKGIKAEHVIMTSDESDEDWWKEVVDVGWYRLDHSKTEELYGQWYTTLIDAVVQSNGWGFVGTHSSTMSIIALLRVRTWRDGAVRMVKWKHPDADDH